MISVLHPTARVSPSEAFPQGWYAAYRQWMSTCDSLANVEYIVAVHESRWERFWIDAINNNWIISGAGMEVESATVLTGDDIWLIVIKNCKRDCVVDQINEAAKYATGDILMGCMDDLSAPEHWDTLIREALPTDEDALLIMSTGAPPQRDLELMITNAFTRARYERYGFILDPAFESMFSDNWFSMQARKDEAAGLTRIIVRLDIAFDHKHPSKGTGVMDEAYSIENRPEAYENGLRAMRHKMGDTRPTLVMCLPGEKFSAEVVANLLSLSFHLSQKFSLVPPLFQYSSNVYACRNALAKRISAPPIADWVLWMDDDNILSIEAFEKLWSAMQEADAPDLIAAWCWIWDQQTGEAIPSCGMLEPMDPYNGTVRFTAVPADTSKFMGGVKRMDYTGFPSVLHRGEIMRKLVVPQFGPVLSVDGEDISFCLRCRQLGFTIGVHTGVLIPHLKLSNFQPAAKEARDARPVPDIG